MPSKALQNFTLRMRDVDQLLEAHAVLTQSQRARNAARLAGGDLAKIATVIEKLVTRPGPGRPSQVEALNRAAVVLLCAQLQGYVEEVYQESARVLLASKVKDLQALVDQGRSGFSNPHADRIDSLFASIALPPVMQSLSWRNCSNRSVRTRLTNYIRLRNSIAHGGQVSVRKAKVVSFKRFAEVLARNLDDHLANQIQSVTSRKPW